MTDYTLSLPGLAVALVLPWLAGVACARLMIPGYSPGGVSTLIGWGYFLGVWLSSLVLRAANGLGAPLYFPGLATALALLGLLCLLPGRWVASGYQAPASKTESAPLVAKVIMGLLLALLAWRYLTMLGIMIEQPLFGWDAMMNWAPKAVVWFHAGELTNFVESQVWLRESAATGSYTLGNRAASTYPEMVPLVFLWHMLGAGTWDHPLLQLPWFLAAINLGLALYGLMRMARIGVLYAIIGSYCLLSLPYLNIHTAIAGYADLWLAATFSIGAIAIDQWERRESAGMTVVAILAACMCMQLKNPGIILGLILFAGLIRSKLALGNRTEWLILATVFGAIAAGFLVRLNVDLPGVGLINLSGNNFQIGMFGPHQLNFHSEVTLPVLRSLFDMANWNLLWWVAAPTLAVLPVFFFRGSRPTSLALVLLLMAVFYVLVFFFSYYSVDAVKFVTLNRALLYIVPVLVYYITCRLTDAGIQAVKLAKS